MIISSLVLTISTIKVTWGYLEDVRWADEQVSRTLVVGMDGLVEAECMIREGWRGFSF